MKKLTYDMFIQQAKELLTNQALYENALKVSKQLAVEDGIQGHWIS